MQLTDYPTNVSTAPPGLGARFMAVVEDLRRLAHDHLELATLEAQRAMQGIVKMLVGAVVVSVLAVTAWIALVMSGVAWAAAEGFSLGWALVIAAVVNLVVAGGLVLWIKKQLPELIFSATLRQLRASAGKEDVDNDQPRAS